LIEASRQYPDKFALSARLIMSGTHQCITDLSEHHVFHDLVWGNILSCFMRCTAHLRGNGDFDPPPRESATGPPNANCSVQHDARKLGRSCCLLAFGTKSTTPRSINDRIQVNEHCVLSELNQKARRGTQHVHTLCHGRITTKQTS